MANAHDRTLLAALGFADLDKREPLHDLGCQYVLQPDVVNVIGSLFVGERKFARAIGMELQITKGLNQYKTTIGFLDAAFQFDDGVLALIEVKVQPVSLGEVLRQLHLYQSYVVAGFEGFDWSSRVARVESFAWIVATTFEMESSFADGLRSEGILPVHLGEGFQRWVAERQAAPKAPTMPVRSI